MKRYGPVGTVALLAIIVAFVMIARAIELVPVADDPLVRMPGTQPADGVSLESPGRCLNCHAGYNPAVEPGFNWKGSMMAQSARDFLFYACVTVAGQDSVWALGRPNAVDLCERCHFPKGWLEGRSDPPNASLMIGADFDGVQCDFCHRIYDPFFETTYDGTREGSDWLDYWDETNSSGSPSQAAADETYMADMIEAGTVSLFNGQPFFGTDNLPFSPAYTESGAGQFFVSGDAAKRASFADAAARHQMLYSRYHKSKYFCNTCHDVSNPALANLGFDGSTPLPSEEYSAYAYFHVERTFSEFMLSDYGKQGGAPGIGPFAPEAYATSYPNNNVAKCQDCHMRDVLGAACDKNAVPIRPNDSIEHPNSGQPLHDLTGGNAWVSYVLASAVSGSPNYDPVNDSLLNQGADVLTLDLTQGEGIDPQGLLAGVERAKQQLEFAASIENVNFNASAGTLSFRVQNQTGHRLISGFPEGRRMFLNVKVYSGGTLIHEINPYDETVGTLRGLDPIYSPNSPPLGPNEVYLDSLVYEMHPSSIDLTGEEETFHFALATGRYKDNRIPPKGFRIAEADGRLSEPVWHGASAPDYFSSAEYAGGYDEVVADVPSHADGIEINLYYQTTSREYIEFLRDEIRGTGRLTLPSEAYIIQTDPFFSALKAWGDTIWQLWDHNKNVPGAAPFLMTRVAVGNVGPPCMAPVPELLAATPGHTQVTLTWSDEHSNDPNVVGYNIYYDQQGKAQLVASADLTTTYTDTNLTNGQEYCYKVTSRYADCESNFSNMMCAIPNNQGQARVSVNRLETGRYEKIGKGKNQTVTFVATDLFAAGDAVTIRAYVIDAGTKLPVANATVGISITGPESVLLNTAPSDANGVAEAMWQTTAPRKKVGGGTTPGSYVATTVGVTADGYSWDGVAVSATFTVQ